MYCFSQYKIRENKTSTQQQKVAKVYITRPNPEVLDFEKVKLMQYFLYQLIATFP